LLRNVYSERRQRATMLKMNAGEVRNIFERLDADRSDDLDRRELKQLPREIGEPTDPASVDAAMRAVVSSGDGAIRYEEFQAWCAFAPWLHTTTPSPLTAAFRYEDQIEDRLCETPYDIHDHG
jgi:hypothetical protein